jgi:hypothetical protein
MCCPGGPEGWAPPGYTASFLARLQALRKDVSLEYVPTKAEPSGRLLAEVRRYSEVLQPQVSIPQPRQAGTLLDLCLLRADWRKRDHCNYDFTSPCTMLECCEKSVSSFISCTRISAVHSEDLPWHHAKETAVLFVCI